MIIGWIEVDPAPRNLFRAPQTGHVESPIASDLSIQCSVQSPGSLARLDVEKLGVPPRRFAEALLTKIGIGPKRRQPDSMKGLSGR